MANPVLTRSLNSIHGETSAAGIEIPHLAADRMTVEGTMARTLQLFVLLLLTATATWVSGLAILAIPAMFIGLGLALWASFSRTVRPGVIVAYAAVEGVFLAGLSQLFEMAYPGIVMNAVIATLATAGAIFFAYNRGLIKVTNKFRQMMMFALIGYMGFGLINLGVSMFTGNSVYNSSFGWIAALIGVGIASFTLILDLADIEEGVGMGAPKDTEWRAAFGLMVSLVWMYTEILRLLAILRGDD
ncbi:MAG: hypothetical protein RIS75_740 [Actinomycetota bacterium]|jgi:uncharacterized YccA/Bax inhibitor family protein